MATRKSEWLASIKPILDRDEAKKDAKELARELGDILEINIDANPENLKQLIDEFNKQLSKMGKQPIVFSENTLQGIVNQFADAIASGFDRGLRGIDADPGFGEEIGGKIGDGVGNAIRDSIGGAMDDISKDIAKKLTELENRRAEIRKQTEKLDKRYQKYSNMYDILSRDEEANISPLKAEENLDQQALKVLEDFTSAEDALADAENRRLDAEKALKKVDRTDIDAKNKATDTLKKRTQEYNAALVKAASAAVDMYRMGETLKQNENKVKDQSILSDFSENGLFETTSDVSDKWKQYFYGDDEVNIKLSQRLSRELADINDQITEIQRNNPEIVDVAVANAAVKSLDEIAAAYDRIAQQAKKTKKETTKDLLDAIEYEPGSQSTTILKNGYIKSRDLGEDWEIQYQWLVKFVKEYEARLAKINAEENQTTKRNKLDTFMKNKEVQELYTEVSPLAKNAEQMLLEIAKKAGYRSDTGSGDVGSGDVINTEAAQKLTEETKKKADEEQRAREEAEKKRLADEASAEADCTAADEAEREQRAKESSIKSEEERQRLLKNKDAIAVMHDTHGEAGAFFNSKTGEFSDVIAGKDHRIETTRVSWEKAAEAFDTRIHKHNYDVAAPSFSGEENDFNVWIQGFDIFKKQMILANKEILSFDFSSLDSVDTLKEIARKYRDGAMAINSEFDGYLDLSSGGPTKFKEKYGAEGTTKNINEQFQVELRKVIDSVMANYQGIMTSISLPSDMIKDSSTPKISTATAEKLRRDSIERYADAKARQAQADAQKELNAAEAEGRKLSLEEQYDTSSDEIKKKYQELVALQDKIDEMEAAPDGKNNDVYVSTFDRVREVYDELAELDEKMFDNFSGAADDTRNNFFEHIRQDALAAEQPVDSLKDSIEEIKGITQNADENASVEDASSAELEAAVTRTAALQSDLDYARQELADKTSEFTRTQAENEAKLRVEMEKCENLQRDLDITGRQLADAQSEKLEAEELARRVIEESDVKDGIIQELREQLANVKTGASEGQASVGSEELKNVLSSITYSVKIVHDDVDKNANKIAIDESTLENTLKRVFVRELNPQIEQADPEPKNEPWALEKTLQTVKSVLDTIQTNTAKPESVEVAPAKTEVGNVLATENTLAAIKTAVEAINNKILGKISGAVKSESGEIVKTPAERKKYKDGTISHGQAEGSPHSMQKLFDYYYWIEEQIEQFKNNKLYVSALQNVQSEIAPKLADYYDELEESGEEYPAWMAPLNEKHNLHMSKIRGEEAQSDSASIEKKTLDILKEEYKLRKEIFELKQKGATSDDVAPFQEMLGIYQSIRETLEFNMADDELLRYTTAATKEVNKGEHQLSIKQIIANIQARKAEDKATGAAYKELIELQKTRNELELKYAKAQEGSAAKQFYAEQLTQMDQAIAKRRVIIDNDEYELELAKMQEAQARKLGEAEAKAADKDAKKQAANAKKMAQREAMLGKTGNAVGRAENTWMNAIGIEGELPADFTAKIDEYYQKLDALRKKHQELKNSDMISDEQKKELLAQTLEINKLTDEIGGLVSEYQKLSGDNVTVIGQDKLDSDAGLDAYNQQLKQAVMTATNGKAQIKNFDAATGTLTYTVKTGAHEFTEYTAAVRRADGALVSVQGATKKTETFFEATARKMKELTSYFSGMAVFNFAKQEFKRGIQYIREIDLALTELKKVTNETEQTYDKFLDTAAKTANKVGSTIKEIVNSTADWARLNI